ncbi:hypothetical protein AB1I63_00345 [Streptococcus pneumoniae]
MERVIRVMSHLLLMSYVLVVILSDMKVIRFQPPFDIPIVLMVYLAVSTLLDEPKSDELLTLETKEK